MNIYLFILAWIVNERTYDLLIDFDNWFQSF
jgi:hypothetical protein